MSLPHDFQFSQSSLQDFVDCARRFQLRYVLQRKWPAVQAAPAQEHERHMRLGAIFHRMIQQHLLGVPAERLAAFADDDLLRGWWTSYLQHGLADLPQQRHPEITLTAPLGDYRLIAKYDLLAVEPGQRAVIVDWKTAQRRPSRERLKASLQTVVYRYVLARAGAHLNGGPPIAPGQIEMVYWFAGHPQQPERFPYDAAQFKNDEAYLLSLAADIASRGAEDFPLTPDARRCLFCTYRSLCDRGRSAGNFLEMDDLDEEEGGLDFDFDFDQIAEIEF